MRFLVFVYMLCLLIVILVISFFSVFILVTSPRVEEQKNSHRTRSSILHKAVDRRMQVRLSACFGGTFVHKPQLLVNLPKSFKTQNSNSIALCCLYSTKYAHILNLAKLIFWPLLQVHPQPENNSQRLEVRKHAT